MTEISTPTPIPTKVLKTERSIDDDGASDYYSALEAQDLSEMTSNTTQSFADDTGVTKDTSGSDLKSSFKDGAKVDSECEIEDQTGSGSFKDEAKMKGDLDDVVHGQSEDNSKSILEIPVENEVKIKGNHDDDVVKGGKKVGDSKFNCTEVSPHKYFFLKVAHPPEYTTRKDDESTDWMEKTLRELELS
ncbi:unnamed protein product [Ambrosiozyma monospora]|uniref:Unnamed protein product n=1 Tax=Ambrosiozyma monospora TaxID=43982 RepID=A0ACB5T4V8_AMBMO|nr:unnamed protein product [Ambrosiozyma monospora]